MTIPQRVAEIVGTEYIEALSQMPESVRVAAHRLANDDSTRPLWGAGLSRESFWHAVTEFEHATDRDHWTDKSQRERDAWLAKFEKTVDSLLELMQDAPHTPEAWGFPARDNVLMNVAYRMGIPLPPASDTQAFFRKMLDLETAADAECWTIADSLKHYREQQRMDCMAKQWLKKPGDAKAGRADFIISMRQSTRFSTAEIATIAQVMFDDESIDDRLVRRLTAGRADSPSS